MVHRIHMRNPLLLVLIMGISLPLWGNEASNGIMVWRLEANEGVNEADVTLLSNYVANQVAKYSEMKVFSEADIRTILKGDEERQRCGSQDSTCMAEIAGALGVPEAVSGDIGRLGKIWMLNLRRLNVREAVVMGRSSRQVEGEIDNLVREIPGAVAELFGKEAHPPPSEPAAATPVAQKEDSKLSQAAPPPPATTTTREAEPSERSRLALYGHVTFWSGLGLAALGGIFNWQAQVRYDAWKEEGRSSDRTANRAFMGSAVAGYAAGGALMTTGVVLWILDARARKAGSPAAPPPVSAQVGFAPDGSGPGVLLLWRW